ncbi:MAG: hypothetical protein ACYDBH_03015 [Acidobacteriaceae bacterium]
MKRNDVDAIAVARAEMLEGLLPSRMREGHSTIDGWRLADIQIAIHALRRARASYYRDINESAIWLRVVTCLVEERRLRLLMAEARVAAEGDGRTGGASCSV